MSRTWCSQSWPLKTDLCDNGRSRLIDIDHKLIMLDQPVAGDASHDCVKRTGPGIGGFLPMNPGVKLIGKSHQKRAWKMGRYPDFLIFPWVETLQAESKMLLNQDRSFDVQCWPRDHQKSTCSIDQPWLRERMINYMINHTEKTSVFTKMPNTVF